ncbi:polar amino acid transport system substrate-binding protein [Arthrobacter sp. 1088]|uniref:substrate-binding periplasmic protein n=1 Tax=Arthrobacter sp. 1088 TaxID=2817768 RepID=UPI00285DA89F|nr:ABC transporter substrate-binding protein [Arthrobacter sp. 1088]MDR6688653.1 polar amino acid transport system substrate-binding protein [Arthrobacter sp. 1088]
MKFIMRTLAFTGALALAASMSACASSASTATGATDNPYNLKQPGTIQVVINSDAKPFTYMDNGKPAGFDKELLDHIANDLNLKVTYTGQEFSAILPALGQGRYDMGAAGISITDERKKTVDFSDGYFVARYAVLNKKGSGITSDKDSLKGKRIAVTQGSYQETLATKNFTESSLVKFTDNTVGLLAVKNGTADALFTDLPIAAGYVQENPDVPFETTYEIAADDAPIGYAIKKGNTKLTDALNTGVKKAIEDGTYKAIYEKYFAGIKLPAEYQPKK